MSFRPSSRGGRLQIPEPPSDDEPIAVPRGPRRTARQTTRHAIASRRTDRAVTQHQGFSHYDDEDWTEEVEEFDGTEYTSRPLGPSSFHFFLPPVDLPLGVPAKCQICRKSKSPLWRVLSFSSALRGFPHHAQSKTYSKKASKRHHQSDAPRAARGSPASAHIL